MHFLSARRPLPPLDILKCSWSTWWLTSLLHLLTYLHSDGFLPLPHLVEERTQVHGPPKALQVRSTHCRKTATASPQRLLRWRFSRTVAAALPSNASACTSSEPLSMPVRLSHCPRW